MVAIRQSILPDIAVDEASMLGLFMFVASTSGLERTVPFDYAWRFQLTLPNRTGCPPFVPGSTTCQGLTNEPLAAGSAQACHDACCEAHDCFVWNFKANGTAPPVGSRCWMGQCQGPHHLNTPGWVSGVATIPDVPSGCANNTNDSSWELVDLPHDYIITLPVAQNENPGGGYFPRKSAVYRKHFVLPQTWQGDRISIYFEGVFKIASIFVNGNSISLPNNDSAHAYTGFEVRLDTESSISYGPSHPNVIAVAVDGSRGSEHWYAGAGIYRSVHLIHTALTHLEPLSIYTPAVLSPPGAVRAGATTADAVVKPVVKVVNDAPSTAAITVQVRVYEYCGTSVVGNSSTVLALAAGDEQAVALPDITMREASLWSIQAPHLYVAQCIISDDTGKVLDQVNSTFGVRTTVWDADHGFTLNGDTVKLRGFCHHDDFTGVGMAMPDRISLMRVMQTRAVGGNSWRMSHNNYRSSVYDLLDAAGVLVWVSSFEFVTINELKSLPCRTRTEI
jgi:hypothetical protein